MFDASWPIWGNILALFIVLLVKHFLVELIQKTPAYSQAMAKGQGWMAFLNVNSGLNAILTFLIFVIPAGRFWAVVYAVIDFLVHFIFGYYRAKGRLPTISQGNLVTAKGWLTSLGKWYTGINSASYLGMAGAAVTLISGKGSLLTDVLNFLKGF